MNQNTALKIENGMSCFEVLHYRIKGMEKAYDEAQRAIEAQEQYIKAMRHKLASNPPRHERLTLSIDIGVETDKYNAMLNRAQNLYYEIKGMRKAVDVIIFMTNYGGELTEQNRRQIEAILNY